MVSGMKKAMMALLVMVLLAAPSIADARAVHGFGCGNCHKSGVSFYELGGNNVCLSCHKTGPGPTSVLTGAAWEPKTPNGIFVGTDASNAMNSYPGALTPVAQTSHMWAVSTDVKPAAGAVAPTTYTAQFNGQYGVSRGKLTCTRCHDPHLDYDTNPALLKVPVTNDEMCKACHSPWAAYANDPANPNANDGLESHPLVANFATTVANRNADATAAGEPQLPYKTAVDNTLAAGPNGNIRLLNGVSVSCTSCHGLHWSDSDSNTTDGRLNQNAVNTNGGDGKMLRSDGATRANKSALCQACHNYRAHGDDGAKNSIAGFPANTKVGCLECHSGHSFNSNDPQYYVLRGTIGAPYNVTFTAPYNYSAKPASHDQTAPWQDGAGANGYCEKCHGDADLIPGSQHTNAAKCLTCHFHNSTPTGFSFESGANVQVCGDCHGFPPHLNARGDRTTNPDYEGGYAYISDINDYQSAANFKDESLTPHNAHAGGGVVYTGGANVGQPIGLDTDYRMGDSEVACSTCHGVRPFHNTGDAATLGSYLNIEFDSRAIVDGQTPPSYDAGANNETCQNVYCHSNGGRRAGDNPTETTRAWSFVETPFTGGGTNSGWKAGKGKLITALPAFGSATECSTCHGNTSATMTSRGNSPAHNKHLDKGLTCKVCHVYTATDNISVPKVARDVSKNAGDATKGTHVNYKVDVNYDPAYTPSIASGTYTAATGTCQVYCHSNGAGAYATPDWDVTGINCASCHGNPPTSGSHAKHVTDANGPTLACAECHVNAASYLTGGGHADHQNGTVNFDSARCNSCHGYDAAQGETAPVWGADPYNDPDPAKHDDYCIACHTGPSFSTVETRPAPVKANALSTGHGKASGSYAQSLNSAANRSCTACHNKAATGHFNGSAGDKRLILGGSGFPAAYSTIADKNNYCGACHGAAPGNPAPSTKTGINSHQAKPCIGCHDPHGDSNIYMVLSAATTQNAKDTTATGKFTTGATVAFTALTGVNSYDEDDGAAGGAGEANADDLCATCHTVAASTSHNNRDNSVVDHNQGVDCFSCHKTHTDATAPFGAGAGNACNACHGNPPATAAHARHATVATHDLTEDRTDCAWCHTGADLYTYDPSADQGAGRNHSNAAGRKTILGTAVGYVVGDGTCTSACHASSVADGAWSDATGLNCNACHYAAAEPSASGANNTAAGTRKLSELSHNKHFDKDKTCSACHDVSYSPSIVAVVGPLTHINDFTTAGAADDGAAYADKGAATQDEAAVVRASMTFDDGLNSCSGGIGLGCHATGTPDWDVAIPANGCSQCHTNFTDATVNPTSGIHDVVPTVSGKQHDDSFTYNGGASTAYCDTCHTTAPSSAHMDGTLNTSSPTIAIAAAVGFTDGATPTCGPNGTLVTCHTDAGVWKRKWHDNAAATNGTQCAGCHGDWTQGWNTGVTHRTDANPRTTHGSGTSYQCKDCHALEASAGYPFANTTNDWQVVELGTTKHGDNLITMNSNGTTFARGTGGNAGKSGCAACHAAYDGTVTPQHSFTTTTWTLQTVAGDAPAVGCFSCHGGATTGVSKKNYWPDGANTQGDNGTPDNSGEHAAHITKLALQVYGETVSGAADNDILKDNTTLNPALTSDAKQKELCSYCHNTPGADGDHGNTYPADVNTMYTLWSKTLDNGVYTGASATCATVDCHNNKSTATAYDWYDGAASACVMCHLDVTAETAHTAHTGAQATFGISIGCANCHQAATNWGTNTPPATGHINGTFAVAGSTAFTYSGFTYPSVKGTCGTNNCHNNGKNAATPAYTWGTPISGCTACHGDTTATLTTQSHAVHTGSTIQTIACGQCHAAATAATHIDTNVTFGGSVGFTYAGDVAITGTTFGGCGTNNCHNNGKNAAPRTSVYTWGTTIATTCGECHGDTAATLTTQAHAAHLNASGTYGRTIACTDCHTAATNLTNHVNATINFTGLTYSGDVAITGTTFGSCGTNACHENGLGAAPAQATYNWDTTIAGCSFCHNSAAMTSGSHTTHVGTANAWGPYPAGSTNCGECHQANANNTSMAAQASHINGTNDFAGSTTLAATTACNTCHGGATPAGTAKTNWAAATRVTCESCHGDYTQAVINTKTAPNNAGASFDSYGHGKPVVVAGTSGDLCADCHDTVAAGHLDGTTGDDKRLKVVNGQNYGTGPNAFCASACHATTMNVHFNNSNTVGGTSDNGDFCYICHNAHGQNGNQDAMIRSTIQGRAVSGFTSKASRSSYSQAGFNGVCQVCHDGAEVSHFNRATNETTHNSPTLCTDCHSHTAATAFSPSGGGCNGCHGYPPVQRLTGAGAPYTYAKVEDYPGGGRAHAVAAHLNPTGLDPTDGWTPCTPCHTETDHNMGLGVGNLLTNRDASATWGNEATRYPRVNIAPAYDKNGAGSGFYNMGARDTAAGMGNCSSTTCHFGESPKWDCVPASTTNDPQ